MRFILAIFIGGGFLCYMGYQEVVLRGVAKAEPQALTVQQLINDGIGENANVKLEEFIVCEWAYIYKGDAGDMDTVWVPLIPVNGAYHQKLMAAFDENGNQIGDVPPLENVRVVLKSSDIGNETELGQLQEAHTITGMVINEVESMSGEELDLLRESYPRTNASQIQLVEHNRKPKGWGAVLGFFGGGGALIAFGGFLTLSSLRSEDD